MDGTLLSRFILTHFALLEENSNLHETDFAFAALSSEICFTGVTGVRSVPGINLWIRE